ncbi:VanZ family protein [Limnohabitans sp.]|uniref:VanZ family protein n=1 Tax=Limnohabitans sp. TaxID=1907725 RepID=UPI0038B8F47C
MIYTGLVLYASLYPFSDWRDQGIAPWSFMAAPLPRYWTWFDVWSNLAGYAPLGFLIALGALRNGRGARSGSAAAMAVGLSAFLSFSMECLQTYLPVRVPSNVDFALNSFGALTGAGVAVALERWGMLVRWSRFRARWFIREARGALVLIALWPFALLFPAAVPLGLGQVFERVEAAVSEALSNTPFLEWLPMREMDFQPLVPAAELACVSLGLLVPCLLGFCIIREHWQRGVYALLTVVTGVLASALSAALSYGPAHAWAWMTQPVQFGLLGALMVLPLLMFLPRRVCAALLLLALAIHLSILNQAPASAYFSQTLQNWEQGQFIRFHGLAQWLGWVWPFAAVLYVVVLLSGHSREN